MKTILVTGDPICDHNFYRGNRATADSPKALGFRGKTSGGGALLLHRLIEATMKRLSRRWRVEFGLKVNYEALPQEYHAHCLWEPQLYDPNEKNDDNKYEVWRAVEPSLGYGQRAKVPTTKRKKAAGARLKSLGVRLRRSTAPDIVVIDDAGLDFRRRESRARWPLDGKWTDKSPSWVVLKLSGPVGEGDLWTEILKQARDKLVVVIAADQLRRFDVRLSCGLSWEATVEDALAELETNPALAPLREARHVVVTFRSDGALWFDNDRKTRRAQLIFDAAHAEGEQEFSSGQGNAFGYSSCFTAAIVHELCRAVKGPDLGIALASALGACRELRRLGNGRVMKREADGSEVPVGEADLGFPAETIAECIRNPQDKFVCAPLPPKNEGRGSWMMLDEWQVQARIKTRMRPHFDAALAVAVLGPDALERFPVAKFGALRTVDRNEIETLRTLRDVITAYEKGGPQEKPLSIGVFGPPGAGKSFGVKQISRAVLGKNVPIKTFNLSQFSDSADLNGAFHQIRDEVLGGKTPVIFWDEFDSQGYRWLQYLLAPMQDGSFQDRQLSHPIGKCIFIFAGATSNTYETFGPRSPESVKSEERNSITDTRWREIEGEYQDFVLKKGPDFRSRLVGYLNVLGPNPRLIHEDRKGARIWTDDKTDLYYPIRRAFFIRGLFDLKSPDSDRLELDVGVLRALLEIPRFKSGSRSLEFLCEYLKNRARGVPRRSQLPGRDLLNMHVEEAEFWKLCERDLTFQDRVRPLAPYLNAAYDIRSGKIVKSPQALFDKLTDDFKAANVEQARRIPQILRLIGLRLVEGETVPYEKLADARTPQDEAMRRTLSDPDNLEVLAEAEHNGWMVERMLSDWRYSREKDKAKKLHPMLIPYSQLSEKDKQQDRLAITGYPPIKIPQEQFGYVDLVKTVGLRVARQDADAGRD